MLYFLSNIYIMKFSIFLSVIIAILSLVFAFQNNDTVFVTFFQYSFEGSLALIIIAAMLIGFIVGTLLMLPSLVSARIESKRQKKDIVRIEKELSESGTITYESEGLGEEGELKRDDL